MKLIFDKNFEFGAATSGPQTEGDTNKANLSIFDHWYKEKPSDFFNGVGPNKVCNTYIEYEKDVDLMKEVGLNSVRTSIQWSRIIKDFEKNIIDNDAVQFYRNYFSKIKDKGIKLYVNLFHFDMPQYLFEKGGFENEDVIKYFVDYAKNCFDNFGDLVDNWSTFNEPIASSENQYLHGLQPPFVKDFKRFINVAINNLKAHCYVVKEFKDKFKNDKSKEIGIILNLTPTYPKDNNPKNLLAAKKRDIIFNNLYMDVAVNGKINQEFLDLMNECEISVNWSEDIIKTCFNNKIDFLGLNYYQPVRVQYSENQKSLPQKLFTEYIWEERRINPHRGWEIHPQTIYNIAKQVQNDYGNIKWFISENGMGVEGEEKFKNSNGQIDDSYRIEFYKEHLYWLKKAIEEGSNCFGYHVWTFIDCWSWGNSFKNRYGLIELNLSSGDKKIKKSGEWFKNISSSKEIEIDKDLIKL